MKLHTTTIGDGPKRAALVPGLSGSGPTWFDFAPWIAEHGYTVTLVDQRGHGRSDRASRYLPSDFADDLVDTLPVGLDLIAGHSLGGRSLALAVDRLLPGKAVYLDAGFVIPSDLQLGLPLGADGEFISLDEWDALWPARGRERNEVILDSIARLDPGFFEAPNLPLLSMELPEHPVVPSLVLAADPSPYTPPALQDRLRAGGYEVRVVPGGQHDLHIDSPAETKNTLEDWL